MCFKNTVTDIMSCQTDGSVIHCMNPLFIFILFIVLLPFQNIYERTGKNSEKDKADAYIEELNMLDGHTECLSLSTKPKNVRKRYVEKRCLIESLTSVILRFWFFMKGS